MAKLTCESGAWRGPNISKWFEFVAGEQGHRQVYVKEEAKIM